MSDTAVQYEIGHFYPWFDRQRFFDLSIVEPGEGHPQGLGAVRSVASGGTTILEDIVAFEPPTHFRFASRNGSMPVDDFVGVLFLEQREDGVLGRDSRWRVATS